MLRYFIRRLAVFVPTLLGVTFISFGLIRVTPGDPVLLLLGEKGVTPETYQEMKVKLGLDQPIWKQYIHFVGKAAQGDLGTSIFSKRPVMEEFRDRFPATLELGMLSLLLAIVVGIPMGVFAAVKRGTFFDYTVMGSSLIGYSMPIFWWALILILFFSVKLGLTPVSGRMDVAYDVKAVTGFLLIDVWLAPEAGWAAFKDAVAHLFLPVIALATIPLAVIGRMTRSSMLEVLGEDYIRTAKAKGLSRAGVIGVHALRNAMIPVLTVIGILFGTQLTGAILTETIFSWPGIGKWFVSSVMQRDYPVIQGALLMIALMVIAVNMLTDLAYAWVNPRMRSQ